VGQKMRPEGRAANRELEESVMRRVLLSLAVLAWVCPLPWAQGEGVKKEGKKPEGKEELAANKEKGEETEADKKISALLKTKKVSFDFVDTPVGDALAFMQNLLGVNIVVGPDVDKQHALTLRVNDMNVGSALQWMAKLVGARVEVKDGAIFIGGAGEEKGRPPKKKGEEAAARLAPGKARVHQGTRGRAEIKLDDDVTIELYLSDDDLEPEFRQMLLKLLHKRIAHELAKLEKKEGEWREGKDKKELMMDEVRKRMEEMRRRMEDPDKKPKPEGKEGPGKGQF